LKVAGAVVLAAPLWESWGHAEIYEGKAVGHLKNFVSHVQYAVFDIKPT